MSFQLILVILCWPITLSWLIDYLCAERQAFDMGMIDHYDPVPDQFLNTCDPLHTVKHEGGRRSLELRHIENPQARRKAIVYPFYNGLRRFGSSYLLYLHDLYGKSDLNHKIKTVLLNRINLF